MAVSPDREMREANEGLRLRSDSEASSNGASLDQPPAPQGTLADPVGRFEEPRRPSQAGMIPEGFAASYQSIISCRNKNEATRLAIKALNETLRPATLTVTRKDPTGKFVVIDNYLYGKPWDYKIGTTVPDFSVSTYAAEIGKTVYRDATLSEDDDYDKWFLGRNMIGIPIKTSGGREVESTFALGFDKASSLTETTATLGSIIAAGYSAVADNAVWLDEGVEIGREIEQERMVQRLHDTSVQEIFACECAAKAIMARHAHDTSLVEEINGLLRLLHDANRDLRQVLRDAGRAPEVSKVMGIGEVVEEAIHGHETAGGCKVTLMSQSDLEVSSTIGDVIRSVLVEALANVRKHAQAENVIVSYGSLSDNMFFLNVTDDGIGYDTEKTLQANASILHFGITNMSNLVRRAGGAFSVASEEDAGTVVRVRIPMRLEGISNER